MRYQPHAIGSANRCVESGECMYRKSRLFFSCQKDPCVMTEVGTPLLRSFNDFFWVSDDIFMTSASFLYSVLGCSLLSVTSSPNDL